MKKIIINETASNKLFCESIKMDAERRKSAIEFRKQLASQLQAGTYIYDSDTRTITIDGFKYNIDKSYAETSDGEPIPLHYTLKTVKRLISEYLGEEVYCPQEPLEYVGDETLYEINTINNHTDMKKIRLTESALISMIENTVNEVLDSFSPAEKGYLARQMRKRGHTDNASQLDKQAYAEKDKYYSQDGNSAVGDIGAMADTLQTPITAQMKMKRFNK